MPATGIVGTVGIDGPLVRRVRHPTHGRGGVYIIEASPDTCTVDLNIEPCHHLAGEVETQGTLKHHHINKSLRT